MLTRDMYAPPQSMPGPDEVAFRDWQMENCPISSQQQPQMQSAYFLPSPLGGNGEGGNATASSHALQSDNYKSRLDKQHTREHGKVLLLRNLAPAVTEAEVEGLLAPFARTSALKIYLQFGSGQAFVELGTAREAEEALHFFKFHPTSLKGSIIQMHFSERDCVTIPEERNTNFRVLLATVTNLVYPIDIELLRFLFSRFGVVQKIVSFSRTQASFQALVQMETPLQAKDAMNALHSRNIYDGCNTLQVQPSRLQELTVRVNNGRAWDYTIAPDGVPPNLLSEESAPTKMLPTGAGGVSINARHSHDASASAAAAVPATSAVSTVAADYMHRRFTSPGFQKVFSLPRLPKEVRDWKNNLVQSSGTPSSVLIVYNLTPDKITVTELFNVFSLYGIVQRIKILRDKPDTALVQYSDPVFASMAQYFLQGCALFNQDSCVQIGFSKNPEVKLTMGGTANVDQRTRAFQIQEQRYLPQEIEKFVRSACPPTRTLFVANLREDCKESDVLDALKAYGTVTECQPKNFDGNRKYLLVEMATVQEALVALTMKHNTNIGNSQIKVAFSKLQLSGTRQPQQQQEFISSRSLTSATSAAASAREQDAPTKLNHSNTTTSSSAVAQPNPF